MELNPYQPGQSPVEKKTTNTARPGLSLQRGMFATFCLLCGAPLFVFGAVAAWQSVDETIAGGPTPLPPNMVGAVALCLLPATMFLVAGVLAFRGKMLPSLVLFYLPIFLFVLLATLYDVG